MSYSPVEERRARLAASAERRTWTWREYAWVALSCVILVGVSIAFVDRPAAEWIHRTSRGMRVFDRFSESIDPVPLLAAVGLAIAGIAGASGWRPGSLGRTLIACCFATAVAIVLKEQLKFVFGRTWPETWTHNNPSWIRDHTYGFHPFHGGAGWASFPSGHMTTITAPMAVLWRRAPRFRVLWILPILVVAVGLFGANFHFVGDMIAGIYLGAAAAIGVMAVLERWPGNPERP